MSVASPVLLAVAVVAAMVTLGLQAMAARRRRQRLARLGAPLAIQRLVGAGSRRRRWLKSGLVAAAVTGIFVAAARPRRPGGDGDPALGLDLVIAVDVSRSMLVNDDGDGTRLEHVRDEVISLLASLPGDRVALLAFAGAAVHFPLSHDHDVLVEMSKSIGPAELPGGSDLEGALRLARCLLRSEIISEAWCDGVGGRGGGGAPLDPMAPPTARADAETDPRGKAVLLFSDGGEIDDATAIEVARLRSVGIGVFIVGVGSREGGVVPLLDDDGRIRGATVGHDGEIVRSRRDDAGLARLAAMTGDPSRYMVLLPDAAPSTRRWKEAIAKVGRSRAAPLYHRGYHELFGFVLLPALVLLMIEACLPERRRPTEYR